MVLCLILHRVPDHEGGNNLLGGKGSAEYKDVKASGSRPRVVPALHSLVRASFL